MVWGRRSWWWRQRWHDGLYQVRVVLLVPPVFLYQASRWSLSFLWYFVRDPNAQWVQLRRLLQGLPAAIILLVALTLVYLAKAHAVGALVPTYLAAGAAALQEEDAGLARLCFERVHQLHNDNEEARFGLARVAQMQGDDEGSRAWLLPLAPRDRVGYGPAHVAMARELLQLRPVQEGNLHAAEVHLRRALAAQPPAPEADAVLGELYVATRRLDLAEPHLARAISTKPELRLTWARCLALRGDKIGAAREAETSLREAQSRWRAKPADFAACRHCAEALAFLGRFDEALAMLEAAGGANQLAKRRAQAYVHLTWAGTLAPAGSSRYREYLLHLEEASRLAPDAQEVFALLGEVTLGKGEAAEECRRILREVATQEPKSALPHYVLGADAWKRKDGVAAREHLLKAHNLAPRNPIFTNNLAWVLSHSEPVDLPEALRLADEIVARWPGDPRFRGTRGNILVKLERWRDALSDLEACRGLHGQNAEYHATLALVYDKLSLPEMATAIRARAATLKN